MENNLEWHKAYNEDGTANEPEDSGNWDYASREVLCICEDIHYLHRLFYAIGYTDWNDEVCWYLRDSLHKNYKVIQWAYLDNKTHADIKKLLLP
jgi:hypothetical protein